MNQGRDQQKCHQKLLTCARGTVRGFDVCLAMGLDSQVFVAVVAMTLEGLRVIRPILDTEVMHIGRAFVIWWLNWVLVML
jgi:hypothetical protein